MKKPIEDTAPAADVLKQLKRSAWDELKDDLLSGTAYRSLRDTSGEEAVYRDLRRLLNTYMDYRYKQPGTTDKTVKAAEQAVREAHPEISRSEMSQLIGKTEKVANRVIDSGFTRQSLESAKSYQDRKVALAREAREAMFPSTLPEDHPDRRALEKIEGKYVTFADPGTVKSLYNLYKEKLVAFMGATCAYEGRRLEPESMGRALDIIDAVDTALGRDLQKRPQKHPRVKDAAGAAVAR